MDSQREENTSFVGLLNQDYYESMGSPNPSFQMDETQVDVESGVKKARGGNFTIEEDILLVQAWINTSIDPVNGNEQSKKAYWFRIWETYHDYKAFDTPRSQTSLANRWGIIQKNVNKFCGCLTQVESLHQSGLSQQDKIDKAKEMYRKVNNTTFLYEHCWNVLKTCPKWSTYKEKPKKRSFEHASSTAAFRMLAYGVPADYVDEYVRIGEATAIISLQKFVNAVVSIYSDNYLRSPNSEDVARLLEVGESRGFPGMLGSIDCMHWQWKNCPAAWKGIFTGHQHEPTMILEAVASQDLWIWHAFFGLPGSHNDINVLDRSSVFSELAQGRAPPANYSVNGHNYTMGYYLADGIYPQWSTFVKTISCPQGKKAKLFAAAQESTRKDVERAFGVLQARFAIIRGPARGWNRETLINIMKACIILHNMIIEYERNTDDNIDFEYEQIDETHHVQISRDHTPGFAEFIQRHLSIRDRQTHSQLQSDLIEHLWQLYGQS